jgi:hypothetical protein
MSRVNRFQEGHGPVRTAQQGPREARVTDPDRAGLPAALAQTLLDGPITPDRVRRLLRRLRGQPAAFIAETLAAIPDATVRRAVAEAAKTAGLFID